MSLKFKMPSITRVEIHPLVLLSVADHYNRVAKDTKKRVVGCLLGYKERNTLQVTNSFAVPFDEEDKGTSTWFVDFNFLEDMYGMFRRVAAREKVVGWYSTSRLKSNDIEIHDKFFKYVDEPCLTVIQVKEESEEVPTEAYVAADVVMADGRHTREFQHVVSGVSASEPEEVGVEHLLREVQDISLSTLTTEVRLKGTSLRGLATRLGTIHEYLQDVGQGKLPVNQDVLHNLQLMYNLLPNLSKVPLIQSFAVCKNDAALNIYLASLFRAILAIDQLLDNKIENKAREDAAAAEALKLSTLDSVAEEPLAAADDDAAKKEKEKGKKDKK